MPGRRAPARSSVWLRGSPGVAGADLQLERPKDPAHGDFATNVALRTAKAVGRPPRELAAELAAKLADLPEIAAAEVAGPGFVNLRLADAFFLDALTEVGEGYGGGWAAERAERVQVELVSANPTGPITVAAARNGAYGDTVARLLAFAGHTVEREYYYNNAGRADGAIPPVRRRGPERAGPARGRLSRRVHRGARRRARRSRPAHARADRGVARTVPGASRFVGEAERDRGAAAGAPAAPRHL